MNESNAGGMKWHKFLTCFSLWAGAALYVYYGITVAIGAHYGANSSRVYAFYGAGLRITNAVMGICFSGLGAFAIYVRFQLARFRMSAPQKLTLLYLLAILASVAYIVVVAAATKLPVLDLFDSSEAGSLATSIIMLLVNRVYYNKRSDLFVN